MNASNDESSTEFDAETWLEEHGDALFRFALHRVGSKEAAEDLVQDTLIAALRGIKNFEGRSAVRTWLTSILQKKIIDYIRRQGVERKAKVLKEEEKIAETPSFFHRGHWRQTVRKWSLDPQQSLENKEFWRTLHDCSMKMKGTIADAFRLREIEQLSTEEICNILDVTPSNLSVRLHRARLLLRDCLEKNWFLKEESD